ncbi:MAG: triose-phosphate isomerase [Eubacteriaceae bacterium]|nr:triose-phosphate isomerase [Eubacteriaceae bacterium]
MRREIIAGNWKMNKNVSQTKDFINELLPLIDTDKREVVLFPPFTSLTTAVSCTQGSFVKIGAQNMYFEDSGAFTGEVSAEMIRDTGAVRVLVGHSERRTLFGETDETVNRKLRKAFETGLLPIMCVGEDLDQRQKGETFDFIASQISNGLAGIENDGIVVAYEPIWAIGTGVTATSEQAEEVCGFIRERLAEQFGNAAERIRILYGGSVKAGNIKELMAMEDIDGVLVGGASLKSEFADIVNYDD